MVLIAGVLVGIPEPHLDIFSIHLSVVSEAFFESGSLPDYLQGLASYPVGDWKDAVVLTGSDPGAIWVFSAYDPAEILLSFITGTRIIPGFMFSSGNYFPFVRNIYPGWDMFSRPGYKTGAATPAARMT